MGSGGGPGEAPGGGPGEPGEAGRGVLRGVLVASWRRVSEIMEEFFPLLKLISLSSV